MTDYTSDDIKNICTFKTTLDQEIIGKVVQVAQLLNNAVNKEKLFGARGSPWQFNLRDLMRFSQGVAGNQDNPSPFAIIFRYLKLIFVERFRLPQDRQAAEMIIKSVFNFDEDLLETSNSLEIGKFFCKDVMIFKIFVMIEFYGIVIKLSNKIKVNFVEKSIF